MAEIGVKSVVLCIAKSIGDDSYATYVQVQLEVAILVGKRERVKHFYPSAATHSNCSPFLLAIVISSETTVIVHEQQVTSAIN